MMMMITTAEQEALLLQAQLQAWVWGTVMIMRARMALLLVVELALVAGRRKRMCWRRTTVSVQHKQLAVVSEQVAEEKEEWAA